MSNFLHPDIVKTTKNRFKKCYMKGIKIFLKKKKQKRKYGYRQYKNLSENEKKIIEYRKIYSEIKKNKILL